METNISEPVLPTKVPLVWAREVPKGWYLFLLEDNINKIGFPDFRNLYACPNPRLTCCLTRNQKKTMKRMITAKRMIESYAIAEHIPARMRLVHHLERGEKKIHACMIGPLSEMTGDQLKKIEHFVENEIPGVTDNMIGYHGKFHIDDNFFPFGANNEATIEEEEEGLEEKSQKQDKEQLDGNNGDKIEHQEQDAKENDEKEEKEQHGTNNEHTKEQQKQGASHNSHQENKQQHSEIVHQQPVGVLHANNKPVAVIMEYMNQQPSTTLHEQKEEWWA